MRTLEEARQSKLMYHGTSTKFLRSILKKGLIPNPKKQRWGRDMDSQRQAVQPVATLDGYIYLTPLSYMARDIAEDAARKFGGNPLIAVASVSPNSLSVDHDALTKPVKKAARSIADERAPDDSKDPLNWLLGWLSGVETSRQIKVGEEFGGILEKAIGGKSKEVLKYKDGRGEGVKPFLPAKLLLMYLELWHRKNASGHDFRTGSNAFVKGYISSQQDYWVGLGYDIDLPLKGEEWTNDDREKAKIEIEKTKKRWPRSLSQSELEDEWRETIAKVSGRLGGTVATEAGSVMIDEPLTYRGSNRIVALVEIKGDLGELVAVVHYSSLGRSSLESTIDDLGAFSSIEMARERVTESYTLVERIDNFLLGR